MADYKAVVVKAGSGGFGGPLTLIPDAKKNKVVNITGGVMSKVAQTLAEMTGCELVDGFKTRVPDDEISRCRHRLRRYAQLFLLWSVEHL